MQDNIRIFRTILRAKNAHPPGAFQRVQQKTLKSNLLFPI
jgi:hypothetical protein